MKILKIIFVFILLLMSQISWGQEDCPELKSKKAGKKFDEAMKFLDYASDSKNPDNYYKEASKLLVEVKTIDEEYVGSYYYLGYINIKRTDYNLKTAEKYFLLSIEHCPDFNPYAYYYLGQIYFGRKEYSKAADKMKKFISYPERIYSDEDLNNANEVISWSNKFDKFYSNPVPFEPKVVNGVSSQQDDYLAIISPDNKMALFTRRTYGVQPKDMAFSSESKYIEKFMYSIRQENGDFGESFPMPKPFNTNENEGGASLTINNKELFYTVCKYINSQNNTPYYNCDICYTKFEHGGWKPIKAILEVNKDNSWDSQPSISSNGNTLFFISDREGGYGGYDIYTATRDKYGVWSEPVNMGAKINTPGNEKSPFIHTDSQTLYFSSSDRKDEEGNFYKGHEGLGGYDIFYCRMDKNGKWQEPVNIGYPINSESDDVGFFVSTDGQWGYFGSERLDGIGGWDLYTFNLYEEARPEKVLFITGNVKDIAKDPNSNSITKVEIKNVETKKVTSIPVDSETGDYVAAMVFNSDYVLTVKKPDYVYESKYISQKDTSINTFTEVDVEIEPIEVDKSYQLNDINFATNSSDLTKNSLKIIEQFAIFLIENPNIKVSIEGHTDNVGDESSNQILSEERAKAVYDELIKTYKIMSSRLAYVGYGESKPIASNTSENGRAKNRRTVFVITEK